MAMDTLQKLMVQGLQAVYDAEQQGVEGAQEIADAVTSPELKQNMQQGLEQTRNELIPRLETALQAAGATTERVPNDIMKGILNVGKKIRDESTESSVRDAGIIASAQIAMHYYIAAYGTLGAHAKTLGIQEVAEMCEQTVSERKRRDEQLTTIAEGVVNQQAEAAGQ